MQECCGCLGLSRWRAWSGGVICSFILVIVSPEAEQDLLVVQAPPAEEEQEAGLAEGLAEQAPEDAAAAGERLAKHMEVPRCCIELPSQSNDRDSEHECWPLIWKAYVSICG